MDAKELPAWARRPLIHRCVNGVERFTDWLFADIGDDRHIHGPAWMKLGHWCGVLTTLMVGLILSILVLGR